MTARSDEQSTVAAHTPTLYVGTMNDGLFIIDRPPRPAPADYAPYGGDRETRVLATIAGNDAEARTLASRIVLACNLHQEMREALEAARRAIGDHWAPNDCYATGPLTGDAIRDLIECPACSFIAKYDAVLAKLQGA